MSSPWKTNLIDSEHAACLSVGEPSQQEQQQQQVLTPAFHSPFAGVGIMGMDFPVLSINMLAAL
jgi:hypothetical protein